jgi:flavin-dependent dehydrogenase
MAYQVIITGGGLAGLVSGIKLARTGINVLIIERKNYPIHKVCGEYISNEVRSFLENLGLDLTNLGVSEIRNFRFTSPRGNVLDAPLAMGGFGLSRYTLDEELYRLAKEAGAHFLLNTTVSDVKWTGNHFVVLTTTGDSYESEIAVGAYGKRSRLDKNLDRAFTQSPSPYMAVKYHISYDFPKDTIALHNFKDGYCGISAIENNRYCLCYLTHRSNVREVGNIEKMEKSILCRNPHLQAIFREAEFLYDRPEVINEISFAPKKLIENHILMAGDAAGLITPLCGNGMALAIGSGNLLAGEIADYFLHHQNRSLLETNYSKQWKTLFSRRLWIGRQVQRLFGNEILSELTLNFFAKSPKLLQKVIRSTHGDVLLD